MTPFSESFFSGAALQADEQQRLNRFRAQLGSVRLKLLKAKSDQMLPVLSLPEQPQLCEPMEVLAKRIRAQSKGLIVLGTGGSSLGGKTLCALASPSPDFELHYLENLDPHSVDCLLAHPRLHEMHLLIISKSGGTMETLTQAMLVLSAMQSRAGGADVAQHAHAITMPQENALRQLAALYGIPVLEHDAKIGGRFSVLANVSLLPAAVMGVDIKAVLRGALQPLEQLEARSDGCSLEGAAWQAALMPTRPISVLMPYADRLRLLGDWFRQLWAESLGKEGIGSTPAAALGAVDQHSQLQLYLDGPRDKVFTLISFEYAGMGAVIEQQIAGFEYLRGKSVGDAMAALQHGTLETIKRHHLPLRHIAAQKLDEETLGALLMHLMLETMAAAELLEINAFDQPAVEESKQLAREALGAA